MGVKKTDNEAQLRRELAESRLQVERLERELMDEIELRDHLIRISTQLNSTFELDALLAAIMSSAKSLLNAQACSIALLDEETNELVIDVSVGEKSAAVEKLRVPPGRGVAGQVFQQRLVEPV